MNIEIMRNRYSSTGDKAKRLERLLQRTKFRNRHSSVSQRIISNKNSDFSAELNEQPDETKDRRDKNNKTEMAKNKEIRGE